MIYESRKDFGKLFNEVLKTGIGAEIGVQNGYNCKTIFEHWKGQILCVDTWPDNNILGNCVKNLNGLNYKLMVGSSIEVADCIENESLDWIYIDAGHRLEDIRQDWTAWAPKVRKGGIIAGHDYGRNGFGVKQFIDDLKEKGMIFSFTTTDFWEGVEYNSYWTIKE